MKYDTLKFIRSAKAEVLADIALRLASTNEEAFLAAVADAEIVLAVRVVEVRDNYNGSVTKLTLPAAQLQDLIDQAAPGGKVACIKHARQLFNLGLKEAKDLVETLMEDGTLAKINQTGVSLGELFREQGRSDNNDDYRYDRD